MAITGSLKQLLLEAHPDFWPTLAEQTESVNAFDELVALSSLRRKARQRGLRPPGDDRAPLRLAVLGGCSLYPFHELLTHLLDVAGLRCELFLGDYDNYVAEISHQGSGLYGFKPEVVVLLPGVQRGRHPGKLTDPREVVQANAAAFATQMLDLCRMVHERTAAEVILGNFPLPARRDPGPLRSQTLASDWNFRKWVNLELGLQTPPFVRMCDLEFLTNRLGALTTEDPRGWFETKQPGSPALLVEAAREAAHLITGLRTPPRKVLVLDLDNTLWGGVVADDGVEGIEIGDTSPRGEAFKAFQRQILALKDRGVLLGVCSKNDHARAAEPFEKHPEMVLRMGDFVSFKANWEPKSDNILQMAADLQLGADSFVFIDDNPAEIDIVRRYAPAVATILLGPDPAEYAAQLQDSRYFEPRRITDEDAKRTSQYLAERERQSLQASATDMPTYLASLEMKATFSEFAAVDVPRLAQLINKSNQFNLTTRRRTEAEVLAVMERSDHVAFSLRLTDRFGDHGLISIVVGQVIGDAMAIDTWLMSCRVLKRQVEETVLNELARLAKAKGCTRLEGLYLATPKNEMVRNFYPTMGFAPGTVTEARGEFVLELGSFQPRTTTLAITRHAYEPS